MSDDERRTESSMRTIEELIAEKVASFPPLTPEQVGRIARLLWPAPADIQVSEPIALEDEE